MNSLVEFFREYGPLFGILAAVATVLGLVFKIYKTAHDKHVVALQSRIAQLEQEAEKEDGQSQQLIAQLKDQLKQSGEHAAGVQAELAEAEDRWRGVVRDLEKERNNLRSTYDGLTVVLERAQEDLARSDREEKARLNLLKKAMRLEGKVWERKVLQGSPRFRPLAERHAPVLSVLNLKGGVGKTTVTSHLGSALSSRGYRVLLLDLDLQGSLFSLFMDEGRLVGQSREGKLLQHFLLKAAERRKANLLEYCVPILGGRSGIVPNADSMAYAELNLTMHWLLRIGKRDTRFLLRKALHQKRVYHRRRRTDGSFGMMLEGVIPPMLRAIMDCGGWISAGRRVPPFSSPAYHSRSWLAFGC
jgi:hypothetical protein